MLHLSPTISSFTIFEWWKMSHLCNQAIMPNGFFVCHCSYAIKFWSFYNCKELQFCTYQDVDQIASLWMMHSMSNKASNKWTIIVYYLIFFYMRFHPPFFCIAILVKIYLNRMTSKFIIYFQCNTCHGFLFVFGYLLIF